MKNVLFGISTYDVAKSTIHGKHGVIHTVKHLSVIMLNKCNPGTLLVQTDYWTGANCFIKENNWANGASVCGTFFFVLNKFQTMSTT